MSLNPGKIPNSLKAQLDQEERELKAELEGIVKSKKRAVKSKNPN